MLNEPTYVYSDGGRNKKKMSKNYILILMIGAVPLWACEGYTTVANEQELQAYVMDIDNGLVKEKKVGDINISVAYRPTDLLVMQDLGKKEADTASINKLRRKYGNYAYFILSVSKNNKEALYQTGKGMGAFSENVQNLAFRMDQFVTMTTSERDTIPVADFIYPRLYGISSATQVMFVFSNKKIKTSEWINFNLRDFGLDMGRNNFRFAGEDIRKVPRIDFLENIE